MTRRVTLGPGDAAAAADAVVSLLRRAGAELGFERPDPDDIPAIAGSARATGVALVGWRRGRRDAGQAPPSVQLRRALGVFAQERPVRNLPGLPSRFEGVDLVVVRETTEDVYAMLEHETIPDVFESLKVTTEAACERIARHAFELARAQGRSRVTIVHKANIMKLSDGMFLRVGRRVAGDYPDIAVDDVIVDALCMRVVLDPTRFDVLLCGNLFGDIVSDLCAGLVGGRNNAPGICRSPDAVLFTAGHGGDGALPLLIPALHLLRHVGQDEVAGRVERALGDALASGARPADVGGELDAAGFCDAVGERLS